MSHQDPAAELQELLKTLADRLGGDLSNMNVDGLNNLLSDLDQQHLQTSLQVANDLHLPVQALLEECLSKIVIQ